MRTRSCTSARRAQRRPQPSASSPAAEPSSDNSEPSCDDVKPSSLAAEPTAGRKRALPDADRASPIRRAAPPAALELLSPPPKRARALPAAASRSDPAAGDDKEREAVLRRSLQYDEPKDDVGATEAKNESENESESVVATDEDGARVLRRICSGQWAPHAGGVVGREQQKRQIRDVLLGCGPSCLFLVGPPGTGKTSSVEELLADFPGAAVRVNCSSFASPAALYAEVARRLGEQCRLTAKALPKVLNALALDNFLCRATADAASAARDTSVLVLDEVDQLLRLPKRQHPRIAQVIRFLVQWSAMSPSFKFLGIMNGIDMYTQISRLLGVGSGQHDADIPHVVFGSYSHDELMCIVTHYATTAVTSGGAAASPVDAKAIELIARKVAARDGDARRAVSLLQQCARAALQRADANIEDADPVATSVVAPVVTPATPKPLSKHVPAAQVNLRDVVQSSTDMLSTPLARQIAQLPRMPKLLLYVLTTLAPSNATAMSDLNAVSEELARLSARANAAWLPRFSREELVRHISALECYALIKRKKSAQPGSKAFWTGKLASAATMDDVTRALRSDDVLSKALDV